MVEQAETQLRVVVLIEEEENQHNTRNKYPRSLLKLVLC
jgi:hypothetical protein